MLSPEEYKAKIAALKDKANGLSQPAANTATVSSETIPTSEHKGIPANAIGYADSNARGFKQDVILESIPNNTTRAEDSNTKVSPGLLNAGNSADKSTESLIPLTPIEQGEKINPYPEAVIDPEEAYCEACGKSVEDCDCIPSEDNEDELKILASLGISAEKANTFKQAENEKNSKDLETLTTSTDVEQNTLSAAEIVAREYATTEDDLIVFRNIFNQTHEKVKDLLPDQLEQKIYHLDRVIKAIQAMQQACKRLASDKLEKESAKDKAERKEREKGYKIPRRRGSDEVDSTGALKTKEIGQKTKREKLIESLMKAGLSKSKAEALADGE